MNETNLNSGRYLLFLDILGFSKFVENKSPQEVYDVIDSALRSFSRWEELNQQFKTIYFSDTFLFYQEPKGYGDWAFLDVYAIGGMLLSALLAKEIPARGSITFGEFEIKADSTNKHQLYFGKALIEAYETEKREQWIGITIQPSAWEIYEKKNIGTIKALEGEHVWKIREDGVLLLNPFIKLRGWYVDDLIGEIDCPYMEWDVPEFPNDILGFRFLVDKAAAYAKRGDFSGHEAVKYHATVAFLKEVMGEEIFEWGIKISDKNA
ncbi:hypothetical protein KA005_80230 [bacterium]|nr:hypothetical protein [bacterium]